MSRRGSIFAVAVSVAFAGALGAGTTWLVSRPDPPRGHGHRDAYLRADCGGCVADLGSFVIAVSRGVR